MEKEHSRLKREHVTIEKMAELFCHRLHGSPKGLLCAECTTLTTYAFERLRRCPFQERKPTCANCLVHCYKADMREKVRQMMRYAGPRMLLSHPGLAVAHLADGLRKPPVLKSKPSARPVRKKNLPNK